MIRGQKKTGFTIVELLIVVVVIAILAAITIVAFNGIQNRANVSAAQTNANQTIKKILAYALENNDSYPTSLSTIGINNTGNVSYEYSYSNTVPRTACVTATVQSISYFGSNSSTQPAAGGCDGHAINGVPAITNYATNPHAVSGGGAWTNQTPSSGTVSYQATGAQDGGSAYRVITTVAGQIRIGIPSSIGAVTTTDTVSVGVDLYSSVSGQVQVEVGLSTGVYPKSSIINLSVGWNRVEGTVAMPANANVTLVQLVGVASMPIGTTWTASRAIVTKSASVYNYADGNTNSWLWNSTTNNSTSKGAPV